MGWREIEWGLIQGVVVSVVGLAVFFGVIWNCEMCAGVVWLINIFLLIWFWWIIENDKALDWIIGGSLCILIGGTLIGSYSQVLIIYYLLLLVVSILVFLEYPLQALFKKS